MNEVGFDIGDIDEKLDKTTLSLGMDIGRYLGKAVVAVVPGARWDQAKWGPRAMDYGCVGIVARKKTFMNPVALGVILAEKCARGEAPAGELSRLYRFWIDLLERV